MIKDVLSKAIFIILAFVTVALLFNNVIPMLSDTQGSVITEIKKTENY